MTGLITYLALGVSAGAIAKYLMPGNDPGGLPMTMLLGVAGSMIGGWLGSFVGIGSTDISVPGLLTAVAGAMLLLFAQRKLQSKA